MGGQRIKLGREGWLCSRKITGKVLIVDLKKNRLNLGPKQESFWGIMVSQARREICVPSFPQSADILATRGHWSHRILP